LCRKERKKIRALNIFAKEVKKEGEKSEFKIRTKENSILKKQST